jgi:hypothetical protein
LEAIQRGNHDRAKVRQMKEDATAEHAQETGMSEEDVSLYFVVVVCLYFAVAPNYCSHLMTPTSIIFSFLYFCFHSFPFMVLYYQ